MIANNLIRFLLSILLFVNVNCRTHHLVIKNDDRDNILCSLFGFLQHGSLKVKMEKLQFRGSNPLIGFSLDKAENAGIASYVETKSKKCVLTDTSILKGTSLSVVIMKFNFTKKRLLVQRIGKGLQSLSISELRENSDRTTNSSISVIDTTNINDSALKNSTVISLRHEKGAYSMGFRVTMPNEEDKGLYSLYFHNCMGKIHAVNMTLSLVEKNLNSFLSAGEQPRPLVYFAFCGAYFVLSWVWLVVLRASRKDIFRIHYLMLSLVFVKSIALLFHGVNDYVLGKEGIQEEGWAVMYYITYLMRGSLMLITLILIGAGWTYVKHMLHDREKKILLVGISLHGLRFVANIIIDESEIGSARYTTWKEIFILVDLLSVGLVLFPIVWSIRHLSKASQTDGKAALNLRQLKLFRQFYLMVICFIYTSRIIAYLLAITIPFTHTWLVTLFRETTTLIFFVITGYKFRPFDNNPYLLVPDIDMDEETEEIQLQHVVAQSGYAEGTSRVNRAYKVDVDDEVAETGEPSDELSKPLNTDSGSNSAGKTNVISHEED